MVLRQVHSSATTDDNNDEVEPDVAARVGAKKSYHRILQRAVTHARPILSSLGQARVIRCES